MACSGASRPPSPATGRAAADPAGTPSPGSPCHRAARRDRGWRRCPDGSGGPWRGPRHRALGDIRPLAAAGMQELERGLSSHADVLGQEHHAHAAGASTRSRRWSPTTRPIHPRPSRRDCSAACGAYPPRAAASPGRRGVRRPFRQAFRRADSTFRLTSARRSSYSYRAFAGVIQVVECQLPQAGRRGFKSRLPLQSPLSKPLSRRRLFCYLVAAKLGTAPSFILQFNFVNRWCQSPAAGRHRPRLSERRCTRRLSSDLAEDSRRQGAGCQPNRGKIN